MDALANSRHSATVASGFAEQYASTSASTCATAPPESLATDSLYASNCFRGINGYTSCLARLGSLAR